MITTPRAATPEALYAWAIELVQAARNGQLVANGSNGGSTTGTGLDGLPSGTILAWGAEDAPNGWFICDGSVKEKTEYTELYTAILDRWNDGTETPDQFRLPNSLSKFTIGYDGDLYGGSNEITLVEGNLPSFDSIVTDPQHTHSNSTTVYGPGPDLGSFASGAAYTFNVPVDVTLGDTAPASTGITVAYIGTADPIEVKPEFWAPTWIIKQ